MVDVLRWMREDWSRLRDHIAGSPIWPSSSQNDFVSGTARSDGTSRLLPGLYTYRFDLPGGSRRDHLRVESAGNGVLFVDVTDVIHLNSTATELAKLALDGVPRQHVESHWKQRFGRRALPQIRSDLDAVFEMVSRLSKPGSGCPTCSFGDVSRQPLFSTRVEAPFKADLAITYKCNNDCPHCYNEADRLTLESMCSDDWKKVIDKLHQVGVPHLIFTGGEATLYGELPELISHANTLGAICGLNTNGRRMAHSTYANELASSGLNHVQVTLGSHRPEVHDRMMNARSFDQTVRGILNAQAAGLHTITNTTLMQMNASEIEQTIDWLYSLGIRTFAINGMIYSGGGFDTGQAIREELLPPLLIRIRDRAAELGMRFLWYTPTMYCRLSPVELEIGAKRCNAGEYSICVEPNGDILPCQSFYVAAGNLLKDPWESIWQSDLFRSFRDREQNPKESGLPEMCWECPDLQLCGGGCRIEREASNGLRSSAGCAGGCKSGGCSSGGCKTVQIVPMPTADTPDFPRNLTTGFVSMDSLGLPASARKHRGTGVFAEAGQVKVLK